MRRLLVIEDDAYLREELMNTFRKKGYMVSGLSSVTEPEREIIGAEPELILMDINLPARSGFELCRWLKARTAIPVLILTARDALSDELYALGLGADDYLTKPCRPERLLARAERLLETYGKLRNTVRAGGLTLDTDSFLLEAGERRAELTETEGKILRALIERYPEPVSQKELFELLWGGSDYVDENALQVNLTRLRKSLERAGLRDVVQTVRGQGYRLEAEGL